LDREREDIEGESVKQKRDGVDAWLSRINDSQAQPSGMQYPPDPQNVAAAPTDVSDDSWQATRLSWRSALPPASSVSIHSGGRSSAGATEGFSSEDGQLRHLETAVLGRPPSNGSRRKRLADNDGEPLPARIMPSTKRRKIVRQSDAAPTASGTPGPPPRTEDRMDPPRTRALKRKRPTLSSSGRAPQTEPTNQKSRLPPPAAIPAISPPNLTRSHVTNDGARPVEGQGRHLAKRRKPEAPARDFSRQLRDRAPRKKEMVMSTTSTRPGNRGAENLAQPRKQAAPKPNYQPKLRKSARIAALPPKNYR
jgi:hypothetical protein